MSREKQLIEAQRLMKEKDNIEGKINDYESILRGQKVGMKTPLIDADGFPRSDVDIYAVRQARAALAPLYNDRDKIIDDIQEAIILVHQISGPSEKSTSASPPLIAFAKVSGVAPASPAETAHLQRDDLIKEFGDVNSLTPNPLQKIAADLPESEFKAVKVRVSRGGKDILLTVIPMKWSGRGLLGCHLTPVV